MLGSSNIAAVQEDTGAITKVVRSCVLEKCHDDHAGNAGKIDICLENKNEGRITTWIAWLDFLIFVTSRNRWMPLK